MIDLSKLNKEDLELLNKLIETKNDNIFVNSLYNTYFDYLTYLDNDEISSFNESKDIFLNSLELDLNDEYTLTKLNDYEVSNIKELEIKDYINDRYYLDIKPKEVKIKMKDNSYHLYYKYYKPFNYFLYDEIKVKDKDYKEINSLGYFNTPFKYLVLDKNDETWMSIIPHEINTMKEDISKIKGNIVVYGLGLGYFIYLASLKEDVNKIIVIEKDIEIINIFNKYLLPLFNNKSKDKIIILNDDAFSFNETKLVNNKYIANNILINYCYIDIYHNPLDALSSYIRFIRNESKNSNITYLYWIEDSIICYIRRIIISISEEALSSYDDKDYIDNDDYLNNFINKLYFYLKSLTYTSFNDVISLLSKESIKNICKNF